MHYLQQPPSVYRDQSPGALTCSSTSTFVTNFTPAPTGRRRGRPPGCSRSPDPALNRFVGPSVPARSSFYSSDRRHYDYVELPTGRRLGHSALQTDVPQPPLFSAPLNTDGLSEYQTSLVQFGESGINKWSQHGFSRLRPFDFRQKHWIRIDEKTRAVRQIQADIITKLAHLESFINDPRRNSVTAAERECISGQENGRQQLTESTRRPIVTKMVSKSEALDSPSGQSSSEFAVGGRPLSNKHTRQAGNSSAADGQNDGAQSSLVSKGGRNNDNSSSYRPITSAVSSASAVSLADQRPTDSRSVGQPSSSSLASKVGKQDSGHRPAKNAASSTSTASSDRHPAGQPASNRVRPFDSFTDSGSLPSRKRIKKEM